MLDYVWIIPALPAVSFLLILFFGKKMPLRGAEIGIGAVGTSFVLSVVAVFQWIDRVENATGHSEGLAALGRGLFAGPGSRSGAGRAAGRPFDHVVAERLIKFDVGTRVDGLVVMMLFVVTLISLLVYIYSVAYMREEVRFTEYFSMLSLFSAAMLLLVVADNTLVLLVGWEGVGLCSFALIGHFWEEHENSSAALKAFLTTRTGDIGLMIGIIIMFFAAGSFNITATNAYALSKGADHSLLLAGSICLFIGIIGKSGQFPLHTWLPDAMAGPTPVSALIHAATMVVAGVYLGARLYPVFYEGFSIARRRRELHGADRGDHDHHRSIARVRATRHQEGARILHGQPDRLHGDGARRRCLDRRGVPPLHPRVLQGAPVPRCRIGELLGFAPLVRHEERHGWAAKTDADHVLDVHHRIARLGRHLPARRVLVEGRDPRDRRCNGYDAFLVIGLIGAFLTAAYMTRCIYLTFFGEYRGHGHPHESEPLITVPLIILAFFSIVAGFINAAPFGIEKFKDWVEPTVAFPALANVDFDYPKAIISVTVAVLGIGIAAYFWFQREELGPLKGLTQRNALARAGYTFLEKKYYLDVLYENIIITGIKGPIARGVYWFDQHVIDKIVNALGSGHASSRDLHVRRRRPEGGRRRSQRDRRSHRRDRRAAPVHPIRAGAALRPAAVRGRGAPEPRAAHRQHLAH